VISAVKGTLVSKSPDKAELMVGGVGFKLSIPVSTYRQLPETGTEVQVYTSMQVRENSIELMGFASSVEREVFELLIQVSGVGPRLALTIISGIKIEDLVRSILDEDKSLLSTISGIGPKTAGRLVLELKEKIGKIISLREIADSQRPSQVEEAVLALEALGYGRYEAKRSVDSAVRAIGDQHTSDILIKEALKSAGR
jgi:Holliday junction DNA helicase RuvA